MRDGRDVRTQNAPQRRPDISRQRSRLQPVGSAKKGHQMYIRYNEENAAFADFPQMENARILRAIADKVESGQVGGIVMDVNGNRVGDWTTEGEE